MGNFSFSNVPVIRHSRSRFDLSHSVKTSGNVGTLYPFEVQEVYAGDTFKVKTSCVSRLSSQFIKPVMDNLFLDVYYFFVPSRILYNKFVNVFGENTESAWANTVDYDVPMISSGNVSSKTVADYLGLPVSDQLSGGTIRDVNVLPFRAFAKIYDDWFRDQNNISPMHIQNGEFSSSESLNNSPWSPNNYTGQCPKVAKMHDYFTASLPAPQKGEASSIPITISDNVPVVTNASDHGISTRPLHGVISGVGTASGNWSLNLTKTASASYGEVGGVSSSGAIAGGFIPTNLWAQTSGLSATDITVNDLRFAFQYQKMLERDARSGTRYVEYLQAHFGVSAGDYRLQRSEFLGGKRSPISIHQVTQTTGSDSETQPLAQVGAYSLSNSMSRFTKGFVEHGYVIGVFCIRQFHTYQQGVERFWTRSKRVDFFDPVYSHIGEQPVYKSELYGTPGNSDVVYGYNEAWADLRYRPNRVTGQMRTGITDSLDVWHFADYYANAPTLNEQFINETPQYVDRAITVESSVQDQFILDFYIQNIAYRPLPTYSVPSLIDHD